MQMIHKMLDWFKSLFWKEEMELTLVGLQHAGESYHPYKYAFEIIMHEIHRENNICKCDRLWFIQRRHDTHSGLQHEEDNQRKRDDKALGYWRTTKVTPRIVILGLYFSVSRFRSMWERYCRGVNAIVYMVDAADPDKIEASRNELHNLLDRPQLTGIPILVLGNKRDLPGE